MGLQDGFTFLYMWDYHSIFERKNPLALVEAFCSAFPSRSQASLVLKCMNAPNDATNHQRLLTATGDRPDIQILDAHLPQAHKNALLASCDCYVSPHRAEGFGLTMAEAMYLGKPVIATGYSGNLEFMTEANSHLIGYRLVDVGENTGHYPAGCLLGRPRRRGDGERDAAGLRRSDRGTAAGPPGVA